MSYYLSKTVTLPFEDAIVRTKDLLKAEGFGVLTEIDVKETLEKKLGVDFRKYRILGACNPPFAYEVLQVERHIGVLLPCNVIVQESEDGLVEVSAVDPMASMQVVQNPNLLKVANEVRTRLERVINGL
jgi:uncharacterized protein (DUF302 family)